MKLSFCDIIHKVDYLLSDSDTHAQFLCCIWVFYIGTVDSEESALPIKDNTTAILTIGSEQIAFDKWSIFWINPTFGSVHLVSDIDYLQFIIKGLCGVSWDNELLFQIKVIIFSMFEVWEFWNDFALSHFWICELNSWEVVNNAHVSISIYIYLQIFVEVPNSVSVSFELEFGEVRFSNFLQVEYTILQFHIACEVGLCGQRNEAFVTFLLDKVSWDYPVSSFTVGFES